MLSAQIKNLAPHEVKVENIHNLEKSPFLVGAGAVSRRRTPDHGISCRMFKQAGLVYLMLQF